MISRSAYQINFKPITISADSIFLLCELPIEKDVDIEINVSGLKSSKINRLTMCKDLSQPRDDSSVIEIMAPSQKNLLSNLDHLFIILALVLILEEEKCCIIFQ